jgi:multicomponent K+:H+ antiporter subunit F
MSDFLTHATYFAIGCFVVAMTLSLWRLLRGPEAQDRVLALDFLYVNGLLIVLVVGIRYASQTYFEAALLMALFGFLSSTALAKFLLRGEAIE